MSFGSGFSSEVDVDGSDALAHDGRGVVSGSVSAIVGVIAICLAAAVLEGRRAECACRLLNGVRTIRLKVLRLFIYLRQES